MFKTAKNDGDKLSALKSELNAKRAAHETAVANFTETVTRPTSWLTVSPAPHSLATSTRKISKPNLMRPKGGLGHLQVRATRSAAKFASLKSRINLEKTRDKSKSAAKYLESIADEIVTLVADLRPGVAKLRL